MAKISAIGSPPPTELSLNYSENDDVIQMHAHDMCRDIKQLLYEPLTLENECVQNAFRNNLYKCSLLSFSEVDKKAMIRKRYNRFSYHVPDSNGKETQTKLRRH